MTERSIRRNVWGIDLGPGNNAMANATEPRSGTDREEQIDQEQVDRANATGRMPIVFVNGLWLVPSSVSGQPPVLRKAVIRADAVIAKNHSRSTRCWLKSPVADSWQ